MDIIQLQIAADIVFRMCKEHPEICPHDMICVGYSPHTTEDGIKCTKKIYRCNLCGTEKFELIEDNE